MWPFRGMFLRNAAAPIRQAAAAAGGAEAADAALQPEPLFHFGDATGLRRALNMTNRLTGCRTSPAPSRALLMAAGKALAVSMGFMHKAITRIVNELRAVH